MVRKIFPLLWCLFLIGCGGRDENSLADLFPAQVDLQSRPLDIPSEDILNPLYLASAGDYLISANFRTEKAIRIYDLTTARPINDLIHVGRGPNEILNISSMSYADDRLTVYSGNSGSVLTVPYGELHDSVPEITVSDAIEACSRVLPLAYDQYLLEGCADAHLKLVDRNGDPLSVFDAYPDDGESRLPGDNRLIWQGHLVGSSDGKKFAFAASAGTIFRFGKVQDNGSVDKTKEYVLALPEYTLDSDPSKERYSVIWDESCLAGTLSMAAGSDHCFLLHDPDKLTIDREWRMSTVLVFDWEGNPVVKFHLDKPLEAISYNERENTLIGLTSNERSEPQFVSYRLPAWH